jgi:hypothetical protein
MIGVSRKQVSRLRGLLEAQKWSQANVLSPAALVIHYWHHDAEYSTVNGEPRPLPFQGPVSFSTLVNRYAGDVPPGAVRAALFKAGTVEENASGMLVPRRRYFFAAQLDETLLRSACFSMSNLANTIVHNVRRTRDGASAEVVDAEPSYLERSAFTDHISPAAVREFRDWITREGVRFIEAADAELGKLETPKGAWTTSNENVVGVGLYYYQINRL